MNFLLPIIPPQLLTETINPPTPYPTPSPYTPYTLPYIIISPDSYYSYPWLKTLPTREIFKEMIPGGNQKPPYIQ